MSKFKFKCVWGRGEGVEALSGSSEYFGIKFTCMSIDDRRC